MRCESATPAEAYSHGHQVSQRIIEAPLKPLAKSKYDRMGNFMNYAELLAELQVHKALIVHCSRTGKGDEAIGGLFYPSDLRNAILICAAGSELCCSVVWPNHLETFGPVGIVLKPRSTASITSIYDHDSGSSIDPKTGKRVSMGAPFSNQAVLGTFANAISYNEWNVKDAGTIGIFVHPTQRWDVARRCNLTELPNYDPAMGDGTVIGAVTITLADVVADFPKLPIYSFHRGEIVRVERGDDGHRPVVVDPADLYR